jgi:hypothetical protein
MSNEFNKVLGMSAEYLATAIESNSDDIVDIVFDNYSAGEDEQNEVAENVERVLVDLLRDVAANPDKYRGQ